MENFSIELFDYQGNKTTANIGNLDDIYLIQMLVFSGDETLIVVHNDGFTEYFDSSSTRHEDYFDRYYIVYMPNGKNLLTNDNWLNREDSDSMW